MTYEKRLVAKRQWNEEWKGLERKWGTIANIVFKQWRGLLDETFIDWSGLGINCIQHDVIYDCYYFAIFGFCVEQKNEIEEKEEKKGERNISFVFIV